MNDKFKSKFITDTLFYGIIIGLIFLVTNLLFKAFVPFLISLIPVVLLHGPTKRFAEKHKLKQSNLSVFFIVILYILLALFIIVVLSVIYNQLVSLVKNIPEYSEKLVSLGEEIQVKYSSLVAIIPDAWQSRFEEIQGQITDTVYNKLTEILSTFASAVASGTPSGLLATVITVISSAYFAKDYERLSDYFNQILPPSVTRGFCNIRNIFLGSTAKILKGYLILMLITFGELSIGFFIIGNNYGIALAALISILDILPIIGTGTVLIPWSVFEIITGNLSAGISLLVLYVVVSIVRNILEPRIIGKQLDIHPLLTLISFYAGLKLFGITGMLLVPVVVICIKKYLEQKYKINT